MAVALIANVQSAGSTTGAVTAAINTMGASLLVMHVNCYATNGASVVVSDSKGNSWTALTPQDGTGGDGNRSIIYYAANPIVGGSHTFTVGTSGAPIYAVMQVQAFSGIVTASPFDVQNGAAPAAATSMQPGSVTPATSGSLVVTGINNFDTALATVNSGFAITDSALFASGMYYGGSMAYLVQGSAAAVNPIWGWTNSRRNAATIAVFTPAAGVSTPVSSDTVQTYQASSSISADAAQTYLASLAVAADSTQTYIASQTAQADTVQSYLAGVQVAADTAQTYLGYAALSTDSAQTYTAQTQVASDSSQSYPALQSLSADATQTYAGLAYASADSVQAYTALQLVLKDTAQSYLASALVSTDSAQTYDAAVLGSSTVSANSVQSYTAIGLVSADSAQSYTATATAAADSAQGYLALATVGADAPQGYSAFQWTILDTTQTYTAGEQVSVDHPQTYTAFADGFMSVSSDCVQVYGAIGKVSTIPLTGLRNPFGRDRVGISRTYGGRNQISSTNRRHTY